MQNNGKSQNIKFQNQELSQEEAKLRDFVLEAPMKRVIPYICAPLALYQGFSQLFKVVDNLMAAHISSTSVSAVAYLTQINQILLAVGGGLAAGGAILVSRYYGAGNFNKVKRLVNALFAMSLLISIAVIFLIPFTPSVLRFFGTPAVLAEEGAGYFSIGLIELVVIFFNNIYIALERARGNSKRILKLNLVSMAVKFIITGIFVYVFHFGINMIALAGIIANLTILVPGLIIINRGGTFSLSRKYFKFKKEIVSPILKMSFPIMTEKASFAAGKIIINSMSAMYGADTVGALGISNNINGFTTCLQNGFQDGCSSVISQNIGAGKPERALKAFVATIFWNTIISSILCIFIFAFLDKIAALFAPGNSEFASMIAHVARYEIMGVIPLGINAASMALLYGFGYTKLTLCVNFCRVCVFRVPLLWAMQKYTAFGSESVGIVMMVSNILVSILSVGIAVCIYLKVRKQIKA